METIRCPWLPVDKPLYTAYHDEEWGVPSRDPRYLFEAICLEGAQAGLSWWTVLQRRDSYRQAFHDFQPEKVAEMSDDELEPLLTHTGIIRHRGKIFSVRNNARAWMKLREPVDFLWDTVGGVPRRNHFRSVADYPATTPESHALSKALRKAGFNFVGPTTMYAFMQATGMTEDHSVDCFRKPQLT